MCPSFSQAVEHWDSQNLTDFAFARKNRLGVIRKYFPNIRNLFLLSAPNMIRSTWNFTWSYHSSPRLVFSALPLPPLLAPWVKETHSLALCLSLQPARSATVFRSLNRVVFPKEEKGRRGQRDRNKAEGEEGAEQAALCSHGDTGRRQDSQRGNCLHVAVNRKQTDVSGGVWT